jgi:hypothetical protein
VNGDATLPSAATRCANCGATVTRRYCPDCGQRRDAQVHSLWGFLGEATETLTHADSRLWQTLLALLLRPGLLTREFLAGRRARYLPPFRLYFVLSVALFLIASATSGADHRRADERGAADAAARDAAVAHTILAPGGCAGLRYSGPQQQWLQPRLQLACQNLQRDGGHALGTAFVHNVPRAMFIFLPLLAAFMKLLYWRPHRYYVEHLLFLVHNHAFVFLALSLLLLASAPAAMQPLAGWLDLGLALYVPVYLFRAMHAVYAQAVALTLLKFLALGFAYTVSALVMLALVGIYSAVTL